MMTKVYWYGGRILILLFLLFSIHVLTTCGGDLEPNLDSWKCVIEGTCNDEGNEMRNDKCIDKHDECVKYASNGECHSDQSHMIECAKSCGFCNNILPSKDIQKAVKDIMIDITKYGVAQSGKNSKEVQIYEIMESTLQYMRNLEGTIEKEYFNACRNEDEFCAFWAASGECDGTNKYMKRACAPSCKNCRLVHYDEITVLLPQGVEIMTDITKYGVAQFVKSPKDLKIYKMIESTLQYMRNLEGNIKKEHLNACRHEDKLCAYWAANGECDTNPKYMKKNCAPSCRTCHLMHYDEKNVLPQHVGIMTDITKYGVAQSIKSSKEVKSYEIIESTLQYMRNLEGTIKQEYFNACRNENKFCAFWAASGECDGTNKYMKKNCAPSCKNCHLVHYDEITVLLPQDVDIMTDITEFGVAQFVKNPKDLKIYKMIESTLQYMRNLEGNIKKEHLNACRNEDKLCAYWAANGECDTNPKYMEKNCAPSCRTCHLIQTCPPREPALRPFDLDLLFERIVRNDQLQVTVHSKPDLNLGTDYEQPPWIITINNFLSDEECHFLNNFGDKIGYAHSTTLKKKKREVRADYRTSENTWCSFKNNCRNDIIVQQLLQRMENTLNVTVDNFENIQLLRYKPGQFYKKHHDFISEQKAGPRILTFFLYTSNAEEGGETNFTKLDIKIEPKKGLALLWPNVLSSKPDSQDHRTQHEALPVIKGAKFAANAWVHLYNHINPPIGC